MELEYTIKIHEANLHSYTIESTISTVKPAYLLLFIVVILEVVLFKNIFQKIKGYLLVRFLSFYALQYQGGPDKSQPTCTRICRAIPGNKPTPVTCFTVHENLNWMAVGFENGSVVLFKGDVKSDR